MCVRARTRVHYPSNLVESSAAGTGARYADKSATRRVLAVFLDEISNLQSMTVFLDTWFCSNHFSHLSRNFAIGDQRSSVVFRSSDAVHQSILLQVP
jgi:hypothetical protein